MSSMDLSAGNPDELVNPATGLPFTAVADRWVACDRCEKWRRVTDERADISGDKWYCEMNYWDPAHNNCDAEEENSEDDAVAQQALAQQNAVTAQPSPPEPKPAAPKRAASNKRRKKRGSDEEEEESDYSEEDDNFAFSNENAGGGRKSGRAARQATSYADEYGGGDSDDSSVRKPRKSQGGGGGGGGGGRTVVNWSPAADEALRAAVQFYGPGSWTKIIQDPRFSVSLEGMKATALKNRWRKLGLQDDAMKKFNAAPATAPQQAMQPPQQHLQALIPQQQQPMNAHQPQQPTPQQVMHQQVMQQQQMQQQQQQQQQFLAQQHQQQQQQQQAAIAPVPPPTATPFTSYRPYPTHIFDMPRVPKKKTEGEVLTAKDAANQLSTPMEGAPQKKRRGRKPKNDSDGDFGPDSEDSDEAEERANAASGANDNEFKDLDENLDNVAYMYYYDHRNAALPLYDVFSVPMRDLKKQLTLQYQMKLQDALELMKSLGEARDLYTRRNILAKAIHAHISHFQSAQIVRQWCHAVRGMTTQHVHAQHDVRLRDEQQQRLLYFQKHGREMPIQAQQPQTSVDEEHPHGINPKTGLPYSRGPYAKHTPTHVPTSHPQAPPQMTKGMQAMQNKATTGATPGLQALETLPYYWRNKLLVAKRSGGSFPVVQGTTPARALLQDQLTQVYHEWNTPAMTQMLLNMKTAKGGVKDEPVDQAQQQPGEQAVASSAASTPSKRGAASNAPRPSRKRKSTKYKDDSDEDDEDSRGGGAHDDEDEDPADPDEADLDNVYLDALYPIPNIRLKRVSQTGYVISKIVQQWTDDDLGQQQQQQYGHTASSSPSSQPQYQQHQHQHQPQQHELQQQPFHMSDQ